MAHMTLTRILVPTDFSDTAAVALKYATALADVFQARLHVLHVIDLTIGRQWDAELAMVASRDIENEARARSDAELAQLFTRAEREKYSAALVTEVGAPFSAIVKYARREDIDLVVMGTHGRGPLAHLLIGSVAENVVRKAPCPVLTVPLRGHDFVKL
jgi:universal stress protein A